MKKTEEINERIIALAIGALLALGVLAAVIYGLYALVSNQSRGVSDWWAVITTLLVVPAFGAGFWFGKTEVRGFLSGADKMLDKMSGVVQTTVAVRDQSRIAVHNATRSQIPPQYNVILPNVTAPPITHRQLRSGDEMIDL